MSGLIEIEDIRYTYLPDSSAAHEALAGVSLSIGPGDFIAIVGSTGSGKSTLLQVIAGLLRPAGGRVSYEGDDIWADPKKLPIARRLVGLVFQEPERQLFEVTVEDDVAFWPRNAGLSVEETEERVMAAMASVGLDYEVYRQRSPFSLSGGEMRRAAIAGVLAISPKVLILDEPTVGLDPLGKEELTAEIKEMNQAGTAVVLVSHDMDEVAELARRVIVLADGQVAMEGSPAQVFQESEVVTRLGLEPPQMAVLAGMLRREGLAVEGTPLTLDDARTRILSALRAVGR